MSALGRDFRCQQVEPVENTGEANYDAWGQLVSETEIDWLGKTDLRLTSTFTYDNWGLQDSATGPNGVTSHTRNNPIMFVTEQWVDGIGKTVTLTNRFDKGQALGQQVPGDDSKTLLLLTDAKNSIIAESQDEKLRTAVYTAYGERSSDEKLESLLAFNGEVRDPASGWYLLGRGYRAYNPSLMRFHSPDYMSPFGAGGVNPYMYCAGNPIAFSDPTGHARQGQLINNPVFGYVVSAATLIVGALLSLVTLNPGPVAVALGLSKASAVGTLIVSTTGIMSATAGVTAPAATFAGAAAAFTSTASGLWWALQASTGVESLTMFVKNENAAEVLSYFGHALGFASLPSLKTFTPPVPSRKFLNSIKYDEATVNSGTRIVSRATEVNNPTATANSSARKLSSSGSISSSSSSSSSASSASSTSSSVARSTRAAISSSTSNPNVFQGIDVNDSHPLFELFNMTDDTFGDLFGSGPSLPRWEQLTLRNRGLAERLAREGSGNITFGRKFVWPPKPPAF